MRIYKTLCALLLALALAVGAGLGVFARSPDDVPAEELRALSFEELIGYMNRQPADMDGEDMLGFAYLLLEKIDDVPTERLEEIILDPANCDAVRIDVMMLADDLGRRPDPARLEPLLYDETVNPELQGYILGYLDHCEPFDPAPFVRIASDPAHPESGWALKLLFLNDSELAMPIIDELLSAGDVKDRRFGTAITYKGYSLSGQPAEQTAPFIAYCDALLKSDPKNENDLRGLILYTLEGIRTEESLAYLFACEYCDADFLLYASCEAPAALYALFDKAEDPVAFIENMTAIGLPLLGDADGDFVVTASDARLVLRRAVGLELIKTDEKYIADMDADDVLTAADARTVLRTAVSLEPLCFYYVSRPSPVAVY